MGNVCGNFSPTHALTPVSAQVKKLKAGAYFPELVDVQKGRKDEDSWKFVIAYFMKYILPDTKDKIGKKPISDWCPIATEALLFLMIENSYEMWMEEASKNEQENQSTPTKLAKWTERKGSGRKFGGWGNEGIKRFNLLHETIKNQRKSTRYGKKLEEALISYAKELGINGRKRKNIEITLGEEPKYDMPTDFNT